MKVQLLTSLEAYLHLKHEIDEVEYNLKQGMDSMRHRKDLEELEIR